MSLFKEPVVGDFKGLHVDTIKRFLLNFHRKPYIRELASNMADTILKENKEIMSISCSKCEYISTVSEPLYTIEHKKSKVRTINKKYCSLQGILCSDCTFCPLSLSLSNNEIKELKHKYEDQRTI